MKSMSSAFRFLGLISTALGFLPLLEPLSGYGVSGPENFWEYIIYIAHKEQGWFFAFGLLLLLMGLFMSGQSKSSA